MLPSDDEIFLYNENEKQRKFHIKSQVSKSIKIILRHKTKISGKRI